MKMEKWKEYRIKDLGEVVTGNTPPTSNREYYGTEYKFIKPTDMVEGQRFVPTTEEYYSELAFQKYKKCLLPPKTPCVVTIGSLGKKMCLTDTECFTNQAVNAVIPNKENDGEFLYYAFKASVLAYVKQLDSGTTSGRENVSKSSFSKIKVRVPTLPTQKKIASILSAYDNLIQNYKNQIEALQTAASELYKEWFVRFRFPGWKTTKFENGIPKEWNYIQLKDIVKFDRGISYSSEEIDCDDGVNLINLKNIEAYGGFRRNGTKKYNGKYKPEQIVKCGDLVMGITDMTQDRRTVGSVALIPNIEGSSVISADLLKVTTKISKIFFYSLCRFGQHSRYFSMFANGANVLHLRPDSLLRKKILLPTNALIEQFDSVVSSIINKMDKLNLAIDNLTQQRDLLLPRLMSGKLEVE
jgi:type I restriction enzyme S subunit